MSTLHERKRIPSCDAPRRGPAHLMPGGARRRAMQLGELAKRTCVALSLAVIIAAPVAPSFAACHQIQANQPPPGLECYCCKNDGAGHSCCSLGSDDAVAKLAPCTCPLKQADVVSTDSACLDGSDVPAALFSGLVRYPLAVPCRTFDQCRTIDRPPSSYKS